MDAGTGSGNIAISLVKFLPESRITAIDISSGAIELAKENAILNNAANRIRFVVSDLFSGISKEKQFDLMVSNPPYISSNEMSGLPAEVRCEPKIALDGGKDGMDFYRRIIKDSPAYLKKDGIILMEMGYNQSNSIQEISNSSGNFEILRVISDYSRIERVIIAKRN
ncbi:MAG: HemK/PrmC family methyltransferase [Candidatus Omnitrophota bacterium]|nr:HemK/PrmC family methyltransferase [Candidatus Omnitrophota bacterium]